MSTAQQDVDIWLEKQVTIEVPMKCGITEGSNRLRSTIVALVETLQDLTFFPQRPENFSPLLLLQDFTSNPGGPAVYLLSRASSGQLSISRITRCSHMST